MAELRSHVQFLYPGSFFPEESASQRIDEPTLEAVLAVAPKDGGWFGAKVTTRMWTRWTSDDQDGDKWLPQDGTKPVQVHFYVGEVFSLDQVKALSGNYDTLIANMEGNHWDYVCRTRYGNWQPVEQDDVVIPVAALTFKDGE